MDRGYCSGIENGSYCFQNSLKNRIKLIVYYFASLFLTKRRMICRNKIHIVSGKAELRTCGFMDFYDVYYGKTFASMGDLVVNPSHISYLGRVDRMKIILQAINLNFHNGTVSKLSFAIDYCAWKKFFEKSKIKIVLSNGHYDRTTTFLSEICRECNIEFQVKQHGLLPVSIDIPHKIHCNKVYTYDDVQAEIFRKYIIENDDCLYETWYKPGFEFVSKRFDKFTIGIIENKNVENQVTEIYDILKSITKYGKENQDVVIMLHPLSEQSEYEELVAGCRCNVIFTREKYFDFNVIISTPSTLAYDYVRSGYTGPIIFAEFIPRVKDCLENYKNVIHVGSADELDDEIVEMLKV